MLRRTRRPAGREALPAGADTRTAHTHGRPVSTRRSRSARQDTEPRGRSSRCPWVGAGGGVGAWKIVPAPQKVGCRVLSDQEPPPGVHSRGTEAVSTRRRAPGSRRPRPDSWDTLAADRARRRHPTEHAQREQLSKARTLGGSRAPWGWQATLQKSLHGSWPHLRGGPALTPAISPSRSVLWLLRHLGRDPWSCLVA